MQRKLISAAILSVLLISAAYAQTDAPAASAGAPAVSTKKALGALNRQTEQAVRKALSHTKGLDSTAIVIVARSGKVTLDGNRTGCVSDPACPGRRSNGVSGQVGCQQPDRQGRVPEYPPFQKEGEYYTPRYALRVQLGTRARRLASVRAERLRRGRRIAHGRTRVSGQLAAHG